MEIIRRRSADVTFVRAAAHRRQRSSKPGSGEDAGSALLTPRGPVLLGVHPPGMATPVTRVTIATTRHPHSGRRQKQPIRPCPWNGLAAAAARNQVPETCRPFSPVLPLQYLQRGQNGTSTQSPQTSRS